MQDVTENSMNMRAANTPKVEKSQIIKHKTKSYTCAPLKDAEAQATQERSHYTSVIETSKEVIKNTLMAKSQFLL